MFSPKWCPNKCTGGALFGAPPVHLSWGGFLVTASELARNVLRNLDVWERPTSDASELLRFLPALS